MSSLLEVCTDRVHRDREGRNEETSIDEESGSDSPGEGYKWREDVLLRVMDSNGIDVASVQFP